jgi:hypothetical protein
MDLVGRRVAAVPEDGEERELGIGEVAEPLHGLHL